MSLKRHDILILGQGLEHRRKAGGLGSHARYDVILGLAGGLNRRLESSTIDWAVAVNRGGACGGLRRCSGAMLAVVKCLRISVKAVLGGELRK